MSDTSTAYKVLRHLEGYNLKTERSGLYRSNSPLRASSDSHSFVIGISEDREHGWYKDHVTGESGSLYELAELIGIEPNNTTRQDIGNSKQLYTSLAEYAKLHGATEADFTRAGWQQTTYQNRPCLQFTTRDKNNKQWTRYRFIDGNKPVYISEQGYQTWWYGLERAKTIAEANDLPLVIVNGEASVIVAQSYGIPAFCKTSGEGRLTDEMIDHINTVYKGAITITPDCDDTGRKFANTIIEQLYNYHISVVDLGLSKGGDIADFCRLHGESALSHLQKITPAHHIPQGNELLKTALQDATTALTELQKLQRNQQLIDDATNPDVLAERLQRATESIKRSKSRVSVVSGVNNRERVLKRLNGQVKSLSTGFSDLDHYIGGGIIKNTHSVIYGATGMGKSVLVTQIAMNILIRYPHRLLVFPTETTTEEWEIRMACAHAGVKFSDALMGKLIPEDRVKFDKSLAIIDAKRNQIDFVDNLSLTAEEWGAIVEEYATQYKARVIVTDSLSNMAQADDYGAVAAINNMVLDKTKTLNIACISTSQVGRDVSKRANKIPAPQDGYGGGVIENNAWNVLALYRHDYYVKRSLAKSDENFPEGTGLVMTQKARFGIEGARVTMNYEAGVRFTQRAYNAD